MHSERVAPPVRGLGTHPAGIAGLYRFAAAMLVMLTALVSHLAVAAETKPAQARWRFDQKTATEANASLDYDGQHVLSLNVSVGAADASHPAATQPVKGLIRASESTQTTQAFMEPGLDPRIERVAHTSHILELNLDAPSGMTMRLKGEIQGRDAFPCTPDPQGKEAGVIRAVSGMSRNMLNNGVYSRAGDWALAFEGAEALLIRHHDAPGAIQQFDASGTGRSIRIIFKPWFFREHRGIARFDPALRQPRPTVPAGWISWKAYGASLTQTDVREVTDWVVANLRDYGLEYIIIDDGWFVGSDGGMMHNVPKDVDWTRANERFPGGIPELTDYIHSRGLKIGLWLSPFGFSGDTSQHPDWWVRDKAGGQIIHNVWHGEVYADGTNPAARENWLTRGVRAQSANNVDYFKLDGQLHVAYDCYAHSGDYFTSKGTTWQDALRTGWSALRQAADDRYILACWSRVPQIVGFPDAIRIGGDKSSSWNSVSEVASDLASWFHEHNIIWCDDPDHMVWDRLTPGEARTWATLLGLTGTHLTLSERPITITPEKLDILRRVLPVVHGPVVRPAQLYSLSAPPPLWTLELDRPFDHWLVVANARIGEATVDTIDFGALGLDPNQSYTVYDFWNHKFRGVFRGKFPCGVPAEHDVGVYAIRELRPYPWLVSVNRHISQGGVSLDDLAFDEKSIVLHGRSHVVAGEAYVMTIYPNGFEPQSVTASSGQCRLEKRGDTVEVILESSRSEPIDWKVSFTAPPKK
jgi:alpha-galactosidase